MGRIRVNQLRPVAQQQLFELVDVRADDVPADEARAGVAKRLDGADVSRAIEDNGIAAIDETPREQIEPLLGAGNDQDVIRIAAETVRQRRTKGGQPLGRPVTPGDGGMRGQRSVHRLDMISLFRHHLRAQRLRLR